MNEHLQALLNLHDGVLGLLDDPALDPDSWQPPAWAELTLLRSLPTGATLVAADEQDAARLRARLVLLRGRGFACEVVTVDEYLVHRREPGRVVRPVLGLSALAGVVRRHRHRLATIAHRGSTVLAGFQAEIMARNEKNGADPAARAEWILPDKG